mgnify:CR=1 FL=1
MFPAITHEDGTARVQTVTEEQNNYLYNILNCLDVMDDHGVLLNTSLNIKGRPILTTIKEAIEVLGTTDIDHILIEDYLFTNPKKKA